MNVEAQQTKQEALRQRSLGEAKCEAYDIDCNNAVMPIEIKELHIKAVVSAGNNAAPQALRQEDTSKLKREIIKEVTAKVMKTLKQKNER